MIIGGKVCLALGVLGAVGLALLYTYDLWYSDAEEISIGDEQMFYIWMALIGTIVLFALGGALVGVGKGKRKKAMAAGGTPDVDRSRGKKAAAVGGAAAAGAAAVAIAAAEEEPEYEEPGPEPKMDETTADEGALVYECPECGSPVSEDAEACDTCGVRFASDEEDVVVDDEISINVGKKEYPPVIGEEEMPAYEEPVAEDKSELYAPDKKEGKEDLVLDFGDDIDEDIAEDDDDYVYECPECGGDVAEDDVICPHCGAEFED